jgi:hypothetical protein
MSDCTAYENCRAKNHRIGTTPNAQHYGMHFAVTAYPEKSDVIGLRLALRMVPCLPQ